MNLVSQQIINALSLGGIYAMLALGLAIVFSIVRLINFAHGEIMTFGGYGIFLAMAFGFPPLAALAVGIGAALAMALAMERAAFRAMRGADVVSLLITSFAVSEILKVLFQNGISARPVPINLTHLSPSHLPLRIRF
ncbi:MAG: branched-chain amino acid ABC transporter permease, partial [Chloroflexi bacterium]|nr:branched-chain amino acid ABC transporter permease [Chloroflexota bacterium]